LANRKNLNKSKPVRISNAHKEKVVKMAIADKRTEQATLEIAIDTLWFSNPIFAQQEK
jgi:hypothetical protein